jgi:hypothetical protein
MPGTLQYTDMKKCISPTIGNLDETEALLGVKPLDGRRGRRAGRRAFIARRAELWRRAEAALWWGEIVVVKAAPSRLSKAVTLTHVFSYLCDRACMANASTHKRVT